ncbi:hypothetical protein C8R44DRAFT_741686 [Mycena epipterygia]|nr:hypothetical protein C8R44DRAFT_741686 [Mycena epipterygia]
MIRVQRKAKAPQVKKHAPSGKDADSVDRGEGSGEASGMMQGYGYGMDEMEKVRRGKKSGQKRWEYKKGRKNGRKNGGKMATVSDPIDGRVFSREGILSLRTSLAGAAGVLARVIIHNSRSHNMSLLTAKRSKSHRMRQDVVPATLAEEQEWHRRIGEVWEVPQVQAYLYVHLNSSYVSQGLVLRTGGGNERREATAT